ncbi:MAG: hypothetical protein ABEJ68_06915 [Halobacteriaceae archaeon]
MAQGMQQNPLTPLLTAVREQTFMSALVAFLLSLGAFAVFFELIGKPVVAALTVAFAIILIIVSVLFVVVPVSALSLLD